MFAGDQREQSVTAGAAPAEPDLALLYLGHLFVGAWQHAERKDATLDALAGLILEERPKTLLGLAIWSCAEKWLRRHLWMVDFDSPRRANRLLES